MEMRYSFAVSLLTAILLHITLAPEDARGQAKSGPQGEQEALLKARQTADLLTENLKTLLSKELAAGGFAGAVNACATSAQKATAELARAQGVSLRRVSERHRNTADAPDAWEQAHLRKWAALMAEGRAPLDLHETATVRGKKRLRYLRPIILQPMCVNCHGNDEQISPEARKVISRNYPKDLATGFRAGDLRGAISVTVPLE